ncbi:hypothetical protein RM6536_0425 [Rothia mucilaginosa]|uniref:Uncharacterized protein n=1 Tax=Rothia mucilaginosa TaxID=43675 RepID=A0A0K2RYN1_9MICC|nr:hypothetical protein RM6536_0425 [Rothia mucilaginosa]
MFFCNRCNFHGVSKSLSVSRPSGAARLSQRRRYMVMVLCPSPAPRYIGEVKRQRRRHHHGTAASS